VDHDATDSGKVPGPSIREAVIRLTADIDSNA
jgi:hypothetical protein